MASRKTPREQQIETERKIGAAVGNTNQEQVDRRNAIADRADEARAHELQDTDGEKVIESDPDEAEAAAAREAAAAEAERARLEAAEENEHRARALQEEGADRTATEPRVFKLKINGREVEMTETEVLERASKVASADEYLQSAADAVRRSQAQDPSAQDDPASGGKADARELLRSALQGDEEAIEKVAQLLQAPSAVTPDVLRAVDSRLSFHDAVSRFRGEYKDLVSDPFLYRLVVEEDKRLADKEPHLSYTDRLKRAGDTIRTWKQGFTKTVATNPKLDRKATATQVPAAGGRQVTRQDDEESESVESVIDQMAKARGQEQARRGPTGQFAGKN